VRPRWVVLVPLPEYSGLPLQEAGGVAPML